MRGEIGRPAAGQADRQFVRDDARRPAARDTAVIGLPDAFAERRRRIGVAVGLRGLVAHHRVAVGERQQHEPGRRRANQRAVQRLAFDQPDCTTVRRAQRAPVEHDDREPHRSDRQQRETDCDPQAAGHVIEQAAPREGRGQHLAEPRHPVADDDIRADAMGGRPFSARLARIVERTGRQRGGDLAAGQNLSRRADERVILAGGRRTQKIVDLRPADRDEPCDRLALRVAHRLHEPQCRASGQRIVAPIEQNLPAIRCRRHRHEVGRRLQLPNQCLDVEAGRQRQHLLDQRIPRHHDKIAVRIDDIRPHSRVAGLLRRHVARDLALREQLEKQRRVGLLRLR